MSSLQATSTLNVYDLGLTAYAGAYALQKEHLLRVKNGGAPTLLLCEHPAVLTLGRSTHLENFLYSEKEIKRRGIDIVKIDRGGDVTLHAPGQLVVYPIIDLNAYGRDLHVYLHKLEAAAIDLLAGFGIMAERNKLNTGAWVGPQKIASIGIGVSRWVSFHGIALNVNTDLNLFSVIRPCGLDVSMTSMQRCLNRPVEMKQVKKSFIEQFSRIFNLNKVKEELCTS